METSPLLPRAISCRESFNEKWLQARVQDIYDSLTRLYMHPVVEVLLLLQPTSSHQQGFRYSSIGIFPFTLLHVSSA